MSGVVEQAERERELRDYQGYLEQLVECGDISNKDAEGITKLVIDKGLDSLTKKQRYLFRKEVEEKFPQPQCEQCKDIIPWVDAYEHIHSPGLCASCQHSQDRFMEESKPKG